MDFSLRRTLALGARFCRPSLRHRRSFSKHKTACLATGAFVLAGFTSLGAVHSPNKRGPRGFGSSARRGTDAILVANALLFVVQLISKGLLLALGAKVNPLIAAGQYWRLLTCGFLHNSVTHLLINCYSLNNIGPYAEAISGTPRFLAIYMLSTIAGSLASMWKTPNPSVGASGAIFGLGGAVAMFFWRHRREFGKVSDQALRDLGMALAVNFVYGLSGHIDQWGHVGGLAGGALLAWLLGPRLIRQPPLLNPATGTGGPLLPKGRGSGRTSADTWLDQPPIPVLADRTPKNSPYFFLQLS